MNNPLTNSWSYMPKLPQIPRKNSSGSNSVEKIARKNSDHNSALSRSWAYQDNQANNRIENNTLTSTVNIDNNQGD